MGFVNPKGLSKLSNHTYLILVVATSSQVLSTMLHISVLVVCIFLISKANALLVPRQNRFMTSKISCHQFNINDISLQKMKLKDKFRLSFKVSESDDDISTIIEDDDVDFDDFSQSKTILIRKLSRGVIPIAASLGFATARTSNIALRLAWAAVGGTAGFIAKKAIIDKLVNRNENDGSHNDSSDNTRGGILLPKSVTTALKYFADNLPPVASMTLPKIEQIAKKYQISNDDLGLFITQLFAEVVFRTVQQNDDDITELIEVIDFAKALNLYDSEIGDGFSLAAIKIGELLETDERGFFSSDYSEDILEQAAKVFFLGDKMIGSPNGFYGKRLSVALSYFTTESYRDIITKSSTRLFSKCVESVLTNPDSFTKEEISQLREYLSTSASVSSLRPASMQNMIMEAFQSVVDRSIKKTTIESKLNAEISDLEQLKKAQVLLGWNSIEFGATMETRTLPLFEEIARELIAKTVENPDSALEYAAILEDRIERLNINLSKARVLLTTLISEQNSNYMNKIDKVYNVAGNVEPAFKIMVSYAATHDAMKSVVKNIMGDISIPVPGLPFADMVRVNLYELKLSRKDQQKSIISDDMFALNEKQREVVQKTLSLPKVCSWVTQCINENNFVDDAKNAYQKLLNQFSVTEKEWSATSIDFYYQEVQKIASTRAIPSVIDMARLEQVATFLQCPVKSIAKVHVELLGDKYVKAVKESMTPSGTISEEYIDGLNRLRIRLGLSEDDANSLFGVSIRDKIGPIVKELVEIYKSDAAGTKRKESKNLNDKSNDPISSEDNVLGFMEEGAQKVGGGPNVFMREALNLVDLYVDNYVKQNVDIVSLDSLPVNAVGVSNQSDLVDLFKHYTITRLAEQDTILRERYESNEKIFGLSLGISVDGQSKVKESLMYSVYKNMLKRIFRVKNAVEASDLQQFGIIKEKLGLENEAANKIMEESSKGAILEHAASFMRPKDSTISPQLAITFRTQVASLGYDMKTIGFNDKLITYLYALEVQYLIENNLVYELKDTQESYGIPEDRAEEVIAAACKRYISQLLNLALRAAKKFDEKDCVSWVNEILKYSVFIGDTVDADGNMFTDKDKDRLVEFYLSSEDSNSDAAEKLKNLINLSENYVPPVDGIDGLLGLVSKEVRNII